MSDDGDRKRSILGVQIAVGRVEPLLPGLPARAGQPSTAQALWSSCWAYPRSRGATAPLPATVLCQTGLSPLARGNLIALQCGSPRSGPIPARAGQPPTVAPSSSVSTAYPRSRGATAYNFGTHLSVTGLSPLARGNLRAVDEAQFDAGPIPARAGQPRCAWRCRLLSRAYPRSRGATLRHFPD